MSKSAAVIQEIEAKTARIAELWKELTEALSAREDLVRELLALAESPASSTKVFKRAAAAIEPLFVTRRDKLRSFADLLRKLSSPFTASDVEGFLKMRARTVSKYLHEAVRAGLLRKVDRFRYALAAKPETRE